MKQVLKPKSSESLYVCEHVGGGSNDIIEFIKEFNNAKTNVTSVQCKHYFSKSKDSITITMSPTRHKKNIELHIQQGHYLCYDGRDFFCRNKNQLNNKYTGLL